MHLQNRLDKVAGRFKELTGKPFDKITEQQLSIIETISEIEKSIAELTNEPKRNMLQIQKLQRMLIQQKQNKTLLDNRTKLLSKKF